MDVKRLMISDILYRKKETFKGAILRLDTAAGPFSFVVHKYNSGFPLPRTMILHVEKFTFFLCKMMN